MIRRTFLHGSMAVLATVGGGALWRFRMMGPARAESFEITRSEAAWRATLTKAQYTVLREEATEPAGSSPLLHEKREGFYHCAGCELSVYSSNAKYDSGTGWPSFYEAMPDAVRTQEDRSWFTIRTEVHCRRCGGHFGHIFDDGPLPTGKRHCINGVALTFLPTAAS